MWQLRFCLAIKQPVDLLSAKRHQHIRRAWPFEFLFCQGIVIEHKAIIFPLHTLDLITLAISECVKLNAK
jgi:hypothetical protein